LSAKQNRPISHGVIDSAINARRLWQSSQALTDILSLHDRFSDTGQPDDGERRRQLIHHLLFEECIHIVAESGSENFPCGRDDNAALVREIQAYVAQNLGERLDIEDVAYQFHLSRRHLTRIFKENSGETLVDFTNRSRVEHAYRLLGDGHCSVLDAALAVGIESPSYLAKLFKKYKGQLPRQCRKSN